MLNLITELEKFKTHAKAESFIESCGFKLIGMGSFTNVYSKRGVDYVIKFGQSNYKIVHADFSDEKLKQIFLTPLWVKNNKRICIAPKANRRSVKNVHISEIKLAAKTLGIKVGDLRRDNIGRYDGKPYIIDYGCLNNYDSKRW